MTDTQESTHTSDADAAASLPAPGRTDAPRRGSASCGRPRQGWLVWRRRSWSFELATVAACYLIYEGTRALATPRDTLAIAHGRDVLRVEQWMHLDLEVPLNHFLNSWDFLSDVAGYYYSSMHFVVTPLVLVWLWVRCPQAYGRLRSALVTATAVALVVYVLWPVAPPRFTTSGLTDTLVRHHIMGMSNPHGVSGFINQYAAMPSLHVGWAVWCAAAVVIVSRSPWRHLAWLYPMATTFVVLATANHYFLDAVGGAALLAATIALTSSPRPQPELLTTTHGLSETSGAGRSDQHLVASTNAESPSTPAASSMPDGAAAYPRHPRKLTNQRGCGLGKTSRRR